MGKITLFIVEYEYKNTQNKYCIIILRREKCNFIKKDEMAQLFYVIWVI